MPDIFFLGGKMFPIWGHTGRGKGVNANVERIRIESNGGRQLGGDIVSAHKCPVLSC